MKAAFILTSAAFLLFISLLHMYWAAGGKWGLEVAIPRKSSHSELLFRPGKGATVTVAIFILGAGYLLLAKSGFVLPLLPQLFLQWGCILCAAIFFIRAVGDFRYVGFFKRVRQTRFARIDTRLYSPLCVWLGLAFVLALTA